MDDQQVLLLALGTLTAAGLTVSVCGWVLFARMRRPPKGTQPADAAAAESKEPA